MCVRNITSKLFKGIFLNIKCHWFISKHLINAKKTKNKVQNVENKTSKFYKQMYETLYTRTAEKEMKR